MDKPPDEEGRILSMADAKKARDDKPAPEVTITNHRNYLTETCRHKGPYVVDYALNTVECGDCGALLNPMFVLERLAYGEAYWNQRIKDRAKYLAELDREIELRARTRCTHCDNMTAIRYKAKMPQTWVRDPAMSR